MKFYLVYIEATWMDTSYITPLIVKADNITKAKARAKELWRETYGGMGKASTPTLDVYLIELITKKTNVLEISEGISFERTPDVYIATQSFLSSNV